MSDTDQAWRAIGCALDFLQGTLRSAILLSLMDDDREAAEDMMRTLSLIEDDPPGLDALEYEIEDLHEEHVAQLRAQIIGRFQRIVATRHKVS